MKIQIDSTFHNIINKETDVSIKIPVHEYEKFLLKILNNTQYRISIERDCVFTISKKSIKFLKEYVDKNHKNKNFFKQ